MITPQMAPTHSHCRTGHRKDHPKTCFTVKVILFSLITCWSILSVASYEIWSVYFDETRPSLSEDNRTRRQLFEVPFSQSRHVFEIATYINETSEQQIQRMELSLCEEVDSVIVRKLPIGSSVINPINGGTYACVQRIVTQSVPIAVNRTIVRFPQDVGLLLNGVKSSDSLPSGVLLLTIEYNQDYNLLQDNSGFDLYLSDEPVSFESGIMAVGLVPDYRFLVPPNMNEWATKGICHSSCLNYKMEQDEFAVVAMFPTANHRSLQELALHVTAPDGTSRKIFAWGGDTSVDISEEPLIKNRDKLEVHCTYRSENRSITGGLDDDNENCLVWLHYYPRMDLEACLSSYSAATIMSLLDVDELNATVTNDLGLDLTVQGEQLAKFVHDKDQSGKWDLNKLSRSRYSVANGRQVPQCGWKWDSVIPELRRRRRR